MILLSIVLFILAVYTSHLHIVVTRNESQRAMFAAFWDAAWEHCEESEEIHQLLKEEIYSLGADLCSEQVELLLLGLDDQVSHLKAVLNSEVEVEFEADEGE